MAGNLRKRLARLKDLGLVKASELGTSPPDAAAGIATGLAVSSLRASGSFPGSRQPRESKPSFLNGWSSPKPFVWRKSTIFTNHVQSGIDCAPFHSSRTILAQKSGKSGTGILRLPVPSEKLRFFDLETTGLSGGTGTIAFLAAVGRPEGDKLVVEQVFLEDFPGEEAWIDELLAILGDHTIVVTYNGTSFDLPLLRTRCVMNGIPQPEFAHVDALFPARRLWKRILGAANLSLLEREVLERIRDDDIPGAMIPETWLSFLSSGESELMPRVFLHNAEDIDGLQRLVGLIDHIFAKPGLAAESTGLDRGRLGSALMSLGRVEEAMVVLEAAAGSGDIRAGLSLSRLYRKLGLSAERARILSALGEGFEVCIERAKFFEHTLHDLDRALDQARLASKVAITSDDQAAVGSRIARLDRKRGIRGH